MELIKDDMKHSYQDNLNSKSKIFDNSFNEDESVKFQINGVHCIINKSIPITRNKKDNHSLSHYQRFNVSKN